MNDFMKTATRLMVILILLIGIVGDVEARKNKKNKKSAGSGKDPYADYVWPAPPDKPRIKLQTVIYGRADVVARSSFRKKLISNSPQGGYDDLKKPFAVAFDDQGRLLVTDSRLAALIRFDREGRQMDVIGVQGAMTLKSPKGLDIGPDGTIYVADAGNRKVLAYDTDGKPLRAYGREGELKNPTDAAVSPDGARLFVADSKAHRIVIFDTESGELVSSFGKRGEGELEFSWPTSLTFGPEGNLFIVDQINCRVQMVDVEGQFIDQFGSRGDGFGNFDRPKGIAVDEVGFIYVVDNAFNNIQLFDTDFTLLTFIGEGGNGPGRFSGASGVAVRGDELAVVDQAGASLQIFRFIVPKEE